MLIAWAVEAKDVYIYMRDEYPGIRIKMIDELKKLKNKQIIDKNTNIHIRRECWSLYLWRRICYDRIYRG